MNRLLSIFFILLQAWTLRSQLPNTELWLFKIENKKTGPVLEDALNITKREGYDNQPSFSGNGKKIYYVSIREDKQADIYFYDLKKKKNIQLTHSAVSEYSPVETADGKLLTSVVVESDSSQTIHFINALNGVHEKKLEQDSVGYYAFLNADTVLYYKLTEPHSLHFFALNSRDEKWLGNFPTRAFRAIDRNTLLYGLKDSLKTTFFKYNFMLHKALRYADYPSQNEDFVWHPALGLVKSEGSKLLRFNEAEKEWVILFDLSPFQIKKITRFNFDPKSKYLVVAENL
jgi:hypothetical protein